MSSSNNDGRESRINNSTPQHVGQAIQKASQLHAAQMAQHQMAQQQQQQQMIGNASVQHQYPYSMTYPTMVPLPNGGYSLIPPPNTMGHHHQLPQGQLMAAYSNGATYHLTPALLSAHTSLFHQQHQQPTMHQLHQHPATHLSMASLAPKTKQPRPELQRPKEYRDYAEDPESNQPPKKQRSNKDETFPMILYRILSNSECKEYISWLPHGRAFKIHKPEDLEEKVMPLYFRHTKLASFMRQVSEWRLIVCDESG